MPDRYAPWILALVLGLMTWKPYMATSHAYDAQIVLAVLVAASIGFVAGIPFWIRGRRRAKKAADPAT